MRQSSPMYVPQLKEISVIRQEAAAADLRRCWEGAMISLAISSVLTAFGLVCVLIHVEFFQ